MAQHGLNEATLIGHVGRASAGMTKTHKATYSFTLATSESWVDKQGNERKLTEWHRCVCYDRPAEVLSKHVSVGDKLWVRGKLQTRKWQDDAGIDRYTTEVVVRDFQFLTPKGASSTPNTNASAQPIAQQPQSGNVAHTPNQGDSAPNMDLGFDDDVPF